MSRYRGTNGYGIHDICRLLEATDRVLEHSEEIVLLGGGAAAFHRAVSTTMDLDTFTRITEATTPNPQ